MNHILLLGFNRKASEAVWPFALLHASIWLRREICFHFQASVVFPLFNAVQSHVQARGLRAQAALAACNGEQPLHLLLHLLVLAFEI